MPVKPTGIERADWRFLLPVELPVERLVVLGGPANLRETWADLELAKELSTSIGDLPSAQVVAVLAGAQPLLSQVADNLRSGGLLYVEVDRRTPRTALRTPGRVAQRLARSGMHVTASFWVKPDFERCEMFLPLAAPALLRWYLDMQYTAIDPGRRGLELMLRALSRWTPGLGLVAPCFSLLATQRGSVGRAPRVFQAPDVARTIGQPEARGIMLTDAGERVVLLAFDGAARQPLAVLKIPKLERLNAKGVREQQALTDVRHSAATHPALLASIPEPLGLIEYGRLRIGVESYLHGKSLLSSSGRWGVPLNNKLRDLSDAADWIGAFHGRTMQDRQDWSPVCQEQWLDGRLQEFERVFGHDPTERRLFDQVSAHAATLSNVAFPIVWQHNDFSVWNLSRSAHRGLSVIDWEGARRGPALCDLLFFIAHWSDTVRNTVDEVGQLQNFHDIFLAPWRVRPIGSAIHAQIERYLSRVGLDHRFVPILLVLTWVELALGRRQGQALLGQAAHQARHGNLAVRHVGVLAEAADRLLQPWLRNA